MAASLTLQLIAKTTGFKKSLESAEKAFNKSTKKILGNAQAFRKIGSEFKSAGTTISIAFGLPIAAAALSVLRAAGDFEEAFIGVRKTVNATEVEFKKLEADILSMAEKLPFSAVEIAGVAEKAGQLGLKAPEIAAFTKVVLDFATSTEVPLGDAAIALARLGDISGISIGEVSNLASAIVALGNDIKGDELEIIETSLNFAAMGKEIGLTAAQIVAFGASVVESGAKAEAGGTAMSEIFRRVAIAVAESGEELDSIAEISKTTASAFKQSFERDANSAIRELLKGISEIPGAAGDTLIAMGEIDFTGRRLGGTVLALADKFKNLEKNSNLATDEFEKNSANVIEAEKRYASFNSQVKILAGRFNLIKEALGRELIPVFLKFLDETIDPLIKSIKELVTEFSKLDPDDKSFFFKLAAAVVIGGPLLIGLGFLISSLRQVVFAMFLFKQILVSKFVLDFALGIKGLSVAMFTLQGAIAPIVLSILTATAAIGGVLAATLALTGELDFWKKQATKAFDVVKGKVSELSDEIFGIKVPTLEMGDNFKKAFKKAETSSVKTTRSIETDFGKIQDKIEATTRIILTSKEKELVKFIQVTGDEVTLDRMARDNILAKMVSGVDGAIKQNQRSADDFKAKLDDQVDANKDANDRMEMADEEFNDNIDTKRQENKRIAIMAANAISDSIINGLKEPGEAWDDFLKKVIDVLVQMIVQALITETIITVSMAAATLGISLVIALLASVFGGKKNNKNEIRDAVDNFLKEVKRSLEDFEDQVLSTLQRIRRNNDRANILSKLIQERLSVISKLQTLNETVTFKGKLTLRSLFDETTDFFKQLTRLGSNTANPKERFRDVIKEQILLLTKNSQETLDLINAEFDLKKANINEILNLLQRQKSFVKGISQSITDVTREFFSPQQLFDAQKGDIAALKKAIATASGEEKLTLLADLKSALLSSFQTAKTLFAPKNQAEIDRLNAERTDLQGRGTLTPAEEARLGAIAGIISGLAAQDVQSETMLMSWQDSVITGLEGVKTSGLSAFDTLIRDQLKLLQVSQDSLVTEQNMRTLLVGMANASALSVQLLGEIVKNPTNSSAKTISDLSAALSVIFPSGNPTLQNILSTASTLPGGIPMLAGGGIVTKATQAIIGEAGPEAVIPLSKLGTGTTTINVTLHVKDAASLSTSKWEQILKENLGDAMERINRQGFRSSLQPKAIV